VGQVGRRLDVHKEDFHSLVSLYDDL